MKTIKKTKTGKTYTVISMNKDEWKKRVDYLENLIDDRIKKTEDKK